MHVDGSLQGLPTPLSPPQSISTAVQTPLQFQVPAAQSAVPEHDELTQVMMKGAPRGEGHFTPHALQLFASV